MKKSIIYFLLALLIGGCQEQKASDNADEVKKIDQGIKDVLREMDNPKSDKAMALIWELHAANNLHKFPQKKYIVLCLESEILYYNALFDLGADKAKEALLLAQKNLDSNQLYIGNAYNLLGINSEHFSPAYESIFNYTKSLRYTPDHNNPLYSNRAHIASNLGQIYAQQSELDSAYQLLTLSNTYASRDSMFRTLSINYSTLTVVAARIKRWTEADSFLKEADKYYELKGDKDLKLFNLQALAELQCAKGQTDEAKSTIKSGQKFLTEHPDISMMGVFDYLKKLRILAEQYGFKEEAQNLLKEEAIRFAQVQESRALTQSHIIDQYYLIQDALDNQESTIRDAQKRLRKNKEYFRYLIFGVLALMISSLGFIFFVIQKKKSERLKYEKEKSELALRKELEIAKEKYHAILSERERISREFHDGISPNLSSIKLICDIVNRKAGGDPMLIQMPELIDDTIREINYLINEINPKVLLNAGLVKALEQYFKVMKFNSNLSINFLHKMETERLPKDVELNCYRIVQEAIQNITKHTNTKKIDVEVSLIDNQLNLKIQDYGTTSKLNWNTDHEGNGLQNMKSRAKLIDAHLKIESELGVGTKIEIAVSLSP